MKISMLKSIRSVVVLLALTTSHFTLNAQLVNESNFDDQVQMNTITTYAPFMGLSGNSTQLSRGDIGAVSPYNDLTTAFSGNPALLANETKMFDVSTDYVPWLPALRPDMSIIRTSVAYGIGENDFIGFQHKRLNYGTIAITDANGTVQGEAVIIDRVVQLNYAHKFASDVNLGLAAKYYTSGYNQITYVPDVLAVDFGIEKQGYFVVEEDKLLGYDLGLSLNNLGELLDDNEKYIGDFIPASLSLGAQFTGSFKSGLLRMEFDFAYQAQKLLVPTPPEYNANDPTLIVSGYSQDVSTPMSWMQSFYDAPGVVTYDDNGNASVEEGSIRQEEFREIVHQQYLEGRIVIWDRFSVHLTEGVFYEHFTKGGRKHVSIGTGFSAYGFRFDSTYLVSLTQNNPMEGTWGISLGYRWNIGKEKGYYHTGRKLAAAE